MERRNPARSRRDGLRGKSFWFLLGRLPKGTRPGGRNLHLKTTRQSARRRSGRQKQKEDLPGYAAKAANPIYKSRPGRAKPSPADNSETSPAPRPQAKQRKERK